MTPNLKINWKSISQIVPNASKRFSKAISFNFALLLARVVRYENNPSMILPSKAAAAPIAAASKTSEPNMILAFQCSDTCMRIYARSAQRFHGDCIMPAWSRVDGEMVKAYAWRIGYRGRIWGIMRYRLCGFRPLQWDAE